MNSVSIEKLVPTGTILVFSAIIVILLVRRRRETGIKALDTLILLFSSLVALGGTELLHHLFKGEISIFRVDRSDFPIMIDPVRIANYILILSIFIFGERMLGYKSNRTRSLVVAILTSLIILIGIIDLQRDILILTSDIFPFAFDTRLDEFLFDLLQLFVISVLLYALYLQRKVSKSDVMKKYSVWLLVATILYTIAMAWETLEHIVLTYDFNAFFSAVPTVLVLAYVYVLNPRFIYVVPTEIKFLQIVKSSGITVYAADFADQSSNLEFLIGPGLFSISSMIGELIDTDQEFGISSIMHTEGLILFEKHENLMAVVQTSRDSALLRASIQYFLEEFQNEYAKELADAVFSIDTNMKSPDDVLVKCIPIIQSQHLISKLQG